MTFLTTIYLTCNLDVGEFSPIWANCIWGIVFYVALRSDENFGIEFLWSTRRYFEAYICHFFLQCHQKMNDLLSSKFTSAKNGVLMVINILHLYILRIMIKILTFKQIFIEKGHLFLTITPWGLVTPGDLGQKVQV